MKTLLAALCFAFALTSIHIAFAQQSPPGVLCAPSTWTPTAAPPATGWCMWQPSYYMSPANMRFCDSRIPAQPGEVLVYDRPFAQDANGQWYPQTGSQCAALNDSVGGYFDWLAFQYYGWQTSAASGGTVVRGLQLGPGTKVVFSDQPLDPNSPDGCRAGSHCVGLGGNPLFVTTYPDVRANAPVQNFSMASLTIFRQ